MRAKCSIVLKIGIAILAGLLIWKVGAMMLGGLARPIPEPPPPGELRRVRLRYRCSICGTEVRMTSANDEVPDPPRHCQEDMDLVAPRSSDERRAAAGTRQTERRCARVLHRMWRGLGRVTPM